MSQDHTHLTQLMSRIRQKDQLALKELYELTSGRLLSISHRMLQDRGAAEDVLQEVFVNIWQKVESMPALQSNPLAWLTTLVRNRSIDALRQRKPEVPLEWEDESGETRSLDFADTNHTAVEHLLEQESDQQLNKCLKALPEEPREVLELAYFKGLSHTELAEQLSKPLGTIKAWIRRSLVSLKSCMQEAL